MHLSPIFFAIELLIDFWTTICNLALALVRIFLANFCLWFSPVIFSFAHISEDINHLHLNPLLATSPFLSVFSPSICLSVCLPWPLGPVLDFGLFRKGHPLSFGLLLFCWHFYWPGSCAASIYKIVRSYFCWGGGQQFLLPFCALFPAHYFQGAQKKKFSTRKSLGVGAQWALCLNGAPSIR